MQHKRSGMPSKGWLCAYLARHMSQRVSFELAPESDWHKLLIDQGAFSAARPILVLGVYSGLMKRPKGWPSWEARGPVTLYLRFRKVVFRQGEQETRPPLDQSHYSHRRNEYEFELSEMRGVELAERLRAMTPRLGHSPGRHNCSEGPSGKGFPSKQEPAPPPRGSNPSAAGPLSGEK